MSPSYHLPLLLLILSGTCFCSTYGAPSSGETSYEPPHGFESETQGPMFIHEPPHSVNFVNSTGAVIPCSAHGVPSPTIGWFTKDGLPVSDIPGLRYLRTDGSLAFSPFPVDQFNPEVHGAVYKCHATNRIGSIVSRDSMLRADEPPRFLEVFSEKELTPGEWVSLKCTATGNPLPQITWTLDGFPLESMENLRTGDYVTNENYVISFVNISSVKAEHGGHYTCTASSDVGESQNNGFIKVFGDPYVRPMANLTTVAHTDVIVRCPVGGYPIEDIYWEKNGIRLPDNHRQIVHSNGTLILKEVTREADEGYYTCTATNKGGATSKSGINIIIQVRPEIERFTQPNSVQMGQRLSITCTVIKGDPPISIKWMKDGVSIEDKESKALNLRVHHLADYSSTLLFQSVKPDQRGNYTCLASNSVGEDRHTTSMVIYVPPKWLSEPGDVSSTKGDTIRINCQGTGFPFPKISWKKSLNASSSSYKHIGSSFRTQVLENGSLAIEDVQKSDAGFYLCRASNGIGTDLSKVIRVTVHESAHFKSKFRAETYRKGDPGRVICEAFGERPVKIDWLKDNQPLVFDPMRIYFKDTIVNEGTISELNIKSIERKDSALYSCRASNAFGADETSVQLIVQEPPDTPGDLKVDQVTSKSTRLSWSPPFSGNTRITKYIVQLDEPQDMTGTSFSTLESGITGSFGINEFPSSSRMISLPSPAASLPMVSKTKVGRKMTVSPSETSFQIPDLNPLTNYTVRVSSVNSLGSSDFSLPVAFSTEEEVPNEPPKHIKAHPLSSSAIKITWKAPKDRYSFGKIRGHYIGYKAIFPAPHDGEGNFIYKTVPFEEEERVEVLSRLDHRIETVLKSLSRSTKYEIVVQAYNSKGAGPSSEAIHVQTHQEDPPMPPILSTTYSNSSVINIEWSRPREDTSQVTGFVLKGTSGRNEMFEKSFAGTQRGHMLMDLACGTLYELSIKAFNAIGYSERSQVLSTKTTGSVPVAPDKESLIFFANSTSMKLNLNSWRTGGCLIKSYSVKYKQQQEPMWTIISNRLDAASHSVTLIDGLHPQTWYFVQVAATSEAGTSEAEYTVLTTPFKDRKAQLILPVVLSILVVIAVSTLICIVMRKRWMLREETFSIYSTPDSKQNNHGKQLPNLITGDASSGSNCGMGCGAMDSMDGGSGSKAKSMEPSDSSCDLHTLHLQSQTLPHNTHHHPLHPDLHSGHPLSNGGPNTATLYYPSPYASVQVMSGSNLPFSTGTGNIMGTIKAMTLVRGHHDRTASLTDDMMMPSASGSSNISQYATVKRTARLAKTDRTNVYDYPVGLNQPTIQRTRILSSEDIFPVNLINCSNCENCMVSSSGSSSMSTTTTITQSLSHPPPSMGPPSSKHGNNLLPTPASTSSTNSTSGQVTSCSMSTSSSSS